MMLVVCCTDSSVLIHVLSFCSIGHTCHVLALICMHFAHLLASYLTSDVQRVLLLIWLPFKILLALCLIQMLVVRCFFYISKMCKEYHSTLLVSLRFEEPWRNLKDWSLLVSLWILPLIFVLNHDTCLYRAHARRRKGWAQDQKSLAPLHQTLSPQQSARKIWIDMHGNILFICLRRTCCLTIAMRVVEGRILGGYLARILL